MSNITKEQYIQALKNIAGGSNVVTRSQCHAAAIAIGLEFSPSWFVMDTNRHIVRGKNAKFLIELGMNMNKTISDTVDLVPPTNNSVCYTLAASTNGERSTLIPEVNSEYVAWGHYEDILRIVKSNIFAPIFVTGLSGNGKTTMVEQICAKLKRECFRVNITSETDEDELIGSWRLLNGNMEWQDGPVVLAMKRGAILLLDEIDLGTEKCMCLQAPLEGKSIFLKKTRELVVPAAGFNVIATANTKGKGSDDGRFVGTRVMNEAALDRYDFTYEQEYAPRAVEKKILVKSMNKFGSVDEDFADSIVKWTEIIRKSFAENAVDEVISTRRAINICKAYAMFGNKQKAISLALARFDKDTQNAFMSLFNKISSDIPTENIVPPNNNNTPPF